MLGRRRRCRTADVRSDLLSAAPDRGASAVRRLPGDVISRGRRPASVRPQPSRPRSRAKCSSRVRHRHDQELLRVIPDTKNQRSGCAGRVSRVRRLASRWRVNSPWCPQHGRGVVGSGDGPPFQTRVRMASGPSRRQFNRRTSGDEAVTFDDDLRGCLRSRTRRRRAAVGIAGFPCGGADPLERQGGYHEPNRGRSSQRLTSEPFATITSCTARTGSRRPCADARWRTRRQVLAGCRLWARERARARS